MEETLILTIWDSHCNDAISPQIIKVAHERNLVILNAGDATRIQRPGIRKSVVDVSICSVNRISWTILHDIFGSDHFPIFMEFFTEFYYNDTIFAKSKWNKVNWYLYFFSFRHMGF